MANVKQDKKVQLGGAEFKKPRIRLRTRLMESLERIFTTRQEKLAGEKGLLAAPMGRRRMLALGAAAVLAACTPLPAVANPTKAPAKKTKKEVEYEVFTDPKELEPYFKNAEGKYVDIKPLESKRVGDYTVTLTTDIGGIYTVTIEEGPEKGNRHGVSLANKVENINILTIDMGNSNPYIKGTMIVFADNMTVYFQYFNKKQNRHELRGVSLWSGHMRAGPIRTGFEILEDGIDIFNAPVKLRDGDIVARASLLTNGDSGGMFFQYRDPKAKDTRTVAMLDRK